MRNWSCLALSSGPRSKNSASSTFSYHSLVRSRLLIWILMCWINVTLDIASPLATEFVPAGRTDHGDSIVTQDNINIKVPHPMIQPSSLLLPLAHERGQAFSHHHHGRVNGGTHQVGHDRGIDNAQSLQTMHLTVLINYRHRVRPWPHFARPRDVRIGGDLAQ